MKIKSIKTGLEATITEAEWNQMKKRGDARRFTITSTVVDRTAPPADTSAADYSQLVKDGMTALKKQDSVRAKALFLQAQAIKETKLVADKLALIDAAENESE